jgi:hypothetical protein
MIVAVIVKGWAGSLQAVFVFQAIESDEADGVFRPEQVYLFQGAFQDRQQMFL